MPMHDWSRLGDVGFHDFHVSWLHETRRALNTGLLPAGYYACVEQHINGIVPDVMTLTADPYQSLPGASGGVMLLEPRRQPTVETGGGLYYRRNRLITVRQDGAHQLVAVIEVVSPEKKSSRDQLRATVTRATGFLNRGVHLVLLDAIVPGRLDPKGLHWAIWEELTGDEVSTPTKPLTAVSYQATDNIRAYVQEVSPGDRLDDLPLFLTGGCIELPLEATYTAAFEVLGYPTRNALDAPA